MDDLHMPRFLHSPSGKGVAVFIHGFMGSPRQFDSLAGAAHSQGVSAASLLLPGHGGTAKDFAASTYESWQSHLDGELERLTRDFGFAGIWLIGHSMGGLLAINAAVKYIENVRGVFMIACPFKLKTISLYAAKIRLKQLFSRSDNPMKAAYRDNSSVHFSPSLMWRTAGPAVELKKLMHDARLNLPEVRAPVTAVYSTADELTSIQSLDILKAELREAPLDPVVLSDSLHAYYPEHEQALIERGLLEMLGPV